MKRKLKISIILWSLLLALGTIGLSGCDKDEDYWGKYVYQGNIVEVNTSDNIMTIRVIDATPHDDKSYDTEFKLLEGMRILVRIDDFPDITFEKNQKLSFKVISAIDYDPLQNFGAPRWICKIQI